MVRIQCGMFAFVSLLTNAFDLIAPLLLSCEGIVHAMIQAL